jgi:MFS superfamily sulfate permease-like transporter
MKIGEFAFNIREFAGSLGDFGTLIPFLTGYVLVNGFNPSGVLIMLGLTNIVLAFIYKLPLPVQPQKVVGSIAIANKWTPGMVYGVGLGLGIFWLIIGISKRINMILQKIPKSVIRGIQLGLGFILVLKALEFLIVDLVVALISIIIILALFKNRRIPAAISVLLFGLVISILRNDIGLITLDFSFSLPKFYVPTFNEIFQGFLLAGLAQIPLTLTNAVVATTALIKDYFPNREVKPRSLILNMGFMNVLTSFFGGMPLCHGSGGLASQYLYGARTGGALIMEGTIEILLGLFFANSIGKISNVFPLAVLGAMLFFTGLELGRVAFKIKGKDQILIMLVTATLSVFTNLAIGFIVGLAMYFVLNTLKQKK